MGESIEGDIIVPEYILMNTRNDQASLPYNRQQSLGLWSKLTLTKHNKPPKPPNAHPNCCLLRQPIAIIIILFPSNIHCQVPVGIPRINKKHFDFLKWKKSPGRLIEQSIIILNHWYLSSLACIIKSSSSDKPQGAGSGHEAHRTEPSRRLTWGMKPGDAQLKVPPKNQAIIVN